MTQHDRIYEIVKDGDWVCQSRFWAISHSPHKRRAEMSQDSQYAKDYRKCYERFGIYHFEPRDCTHGIGGGKDYKIVRVNIATISGVSVPIFAPNKQKELKLL